MSLRDEIELYTKLSGNDGYHTSISVIGAYLEGYEKGKQFLQLESANDLISRADAIDVLIETIAPPSITLDTLVMRIDAIPSAQPKQGEWIPATWQDEYCPERLKRHKCSECGQRAKQILVKTELVDNYYCNKAEPITEYTHEEQLSKFCPNCGARMEVEHD